MLENILQTDQSSLESVINSILVIYVLLVYGCLFIILHGVTKCFLSYRNLVRRARMHLR